MTPTHNMSDYIKRIPNDTLAVLDRYADYHCPVGDFLQAVLRNDLRAALGRADDRNKAVLQEIVWYVYNEIPATATGSQQAIDDWVVLGLEVDDA